MSKGFDFIYFQKRGDLCAAPCIFVHKFLKIKIGHNEMSLDLYEVYSS